MSRSGPTFKTAFEWKDETVRIAVESKSELNPASAQQEAKDVSFLRFIAKRLTPVDSKELQHTKRGDACTCQLDAACGNCDSVIATLKNIGANFYIAIDANTADSSKGVIVFQKTCGESGPGRIVDMIFLDRDTLVSIEEERKVFTAIAKKIASALPDITFSVPPELKHYTPLKSLKREPEAASGAEEKKDSQDSLKLKNELLYLTENTKKATSWLSWFFNWFQTKETILQEIASRIGGDQKIDRKKAIRYLKEITHNALVERFWAWGTETKSGKKLAKLLDNAPELRGLVNLEISENQLNSATITYATLRKFSGAVKGVPEDYSPNEERIEMTQEKTLYRHFMRTDFRCFASQDSNAKKDELVESINRESDKKRVVLETIKKPKDKEITSDDLEQFMSRVAVRR